MIACHGIRKQSTKGDFPRLEIWKQSTKGDFPRLQIWKQSTKGDFLRLEIWKIWKKSFIAQNDWSHTKRAEMRFFEKLRFFFWKFWDHGWYSVILHNPDYGTCKKLSFIKIWTFQVMVSWLWTTVRCTTPDSVRRCTVSEPQLAVLLLIGATIRNCDQWISMVIWKFREKCF